MGEENTNVLVEIDLRFYTIANHLGGYAHATLCKYAMYKLLKAQPL
jgi:hypothetical protein